MAMLLVIVFSNVSAIWCCGAFALSLQASIATFARLLAVVQYSAELHDFLYPFISYFVRVFTLRRVEMVEVGRGGSSVRNVNVLFG